MDTMATEDEKNQNEVQECVTKLLEKSIKWNHSIPSNVLICMVPDTLRRFLPTAYTPKIFSIGPLHNGDSHLGAMEAQKITYMHLLFERIIEDHSKDIMTKQKEIITNECVKAVHRLDTVAIACYGSSSLTYETVCFVEMMVIDGCFILELLYKFHLDSTLFNRLTLQEFKSDLLLLENQIPLHILQELFGLTLKKINGCPSLIDLILEFFKDMVLLHNHSDQLGPVDERVKHCHILGLLQSLYRPRDTKPGNIPTISRSATEIAGAGVKFKENEDKSPLLAVKFEKSPLFQGLATPDLVRDASFKIPVLCIKYFTVSFLRNLIAYEQCCLPPTEHYVTSFAFLMDKLIETKDDVSLLVRSKVLQHHLGSFWEAF